MSRIDWSKLTPDELRAHKRRLWLETYHRNKHKRGVLPLAERKALRAAAKAARLAARPQKKIRVAKTPAEKREYNRQWRAAHRDRMRELKRAWKAANPDKVRADRRGRDGKSNARRRAWLMQVQRGKCAICGLKLAGEVHIDHIVPRALGGPDRRSNLQLTHAACNLTKNAQHPLDHARSLGRLV